MAGETGVGGEKKGVRDLIGGIGKARRGGTGFASVFQKLVNRNFEKW